MHITQFFKNKISKTMILYISFYILNILQDTSLSLLFLYCILSTMFSELQSNKSYLITLIYFDCHFKIIKQKVSYQK